MKVFAFCLLVASLAFARSLRPLPVKRQAASLQATPGDVITLQYALNIKQLASAFYTKALKQFTQKDFTTAGFSAQYFSDLQDIAFDKGFHVAALQDGLQDVGATPNQACAFNINFKSVQDFVSQSEKLEGFQVSAFQDGSTLLTVQLLIANAQSILVNDAMANAIQRRAANLTVLANPRGQLLSPDEVTTLIQPYIGACPPTNQQLPITPFPPLTLLQTGPYKQNQLLSFSVGNGTLPPAGGFFATFISGENTKTVTPSQIGNNTFKAPVGNNMAGLTYVFVTSVNTNTTGVFEKNEAGILFGPAAIEVGPLSRNASAFDSGL